MLDNTKGKITVVLDSDIKELIPGFLNNREKDILNIKDALKSDDYESIRFLGHNMKGSGSGYGFAAITELGRHIEAAAKEKNKSEVEKIINELENYLRNVNVIYR